MPISHLLLAFLVILVWGCNFIFIKFGLNEVSPLLLCTLRFFLSSVPAIFFIKWPKASFKIIALYGLLMFGLQFIFLFMGLSLGMTPGLGSILIQVQVFFSIFFAMLFLGEIPNFWQVAGAIVSFSGIALVASHLNKNVSILGFMLIISAAASWGVGNLVTKKIGHVNVMSLVVWGSFIAFIPLFLLTLVFEGMNSIIHSIQHLSWLGITSVFYIVYASTWVGYGIWNWLLRRYSVATVAPFTLLVPVLGILSSALIFGEPIQSWKLTAGMLVITGLCINLLGPRLVAKKKLLPPDDEHSRSPLLSKSD